MSRMEELTNRQKYYKTNIENEKRRFKKYCKINEVKLKTPIVCECMGRYVPSNKTNHLRTSIHKKWLENTENL